MLKSYIKLILETYYKRQIGNDLYMQDEDMHNILMRNKKNKLLDYEEKTVDKDHKHINVIQRYKSKWSQKPKRKRT